MGAVLGLLGLGGGPSGTTQPAPQLANIQNGTNAQQLGSAYQGSQAALGQQQALLAALQGQNGIGNQSSVYNQLQGITNGTGPNPAKAQLAQATGQNVANQAALAAGQRGAASNVGLMARQAAQQGSAAQQAAAGQAATLQANQSLNALGQMGSLATQQAGQQIGATTANTAAQQAEQQQLLGAQQAYNQAQVANQGNVNSANAGLSEAQMKNQPDALSGVASTAAGIGSLLFADGGQVANGPQSSLGRYLSNMYANGGTVDAMVSPGEKYLSPQDVKKVEAGADPAKLGRTIPGKPKVGGATNSYDNDIVPAKLDVGGVVIPRSATKSQDPARSSRAFVAATLAKKGKK